MKEVSLVNTFAMHGEISSRINGFGSFFGTLQVFYCLIPLLTGL